METGAPQRKKNKKHNIAEHGGWHRIRIVLAILIGVPALSFYVWRNIGRLPEPMAKPVVASDAQGLRATVVVPTLDSPLPAGKNVIWCASLQLAWDRLKKDVVGEPVKIKGVDDLADKLNASEFAGNDLEAESYYAAAGRIADGTVAKIEKEMAAKFPGVAPDLGGPSGTAAIAYAYLKASIKFPLPYFENRDPFAFKESSGASIEVTSFGIRKKDAYAYYEMREQVEVLYSLHEEESHTRLVEFALDLDRNSRPYQLVVACVKPRATLNETLKYLSEAAKNKDEDWDNEFGPNEVFILPNICFDITTRFRELEGPDKPFTNSKCAGLWLGLVQQRMQFRLDRGGAEVSSEVKMPLRPLPRYFIFDRPFLVYMAKRGAATPFFVMWVDNAELLGKP
jgi:hypothetical protein